MPVDIVRDVSVAGIAGKIPSGGYQFEVGFCLPENMTRLPATGGTGVPVSDNAVSPGSLTVDSVD